MFFSSPMKAGFEHSMPSFAEAAQLLARARPAVLRGSQTLDFLVSLEHKKKKSGTIVKGDSLFIDDPRITIGSCSIDVVVDHFTDKDGKAIKKPLHLAPHQVAIGYTTLGLSYPPADGSQYYLSVDTRSRAARHGLVCRGFYMPEGVRHSLGPEYDASVTGLQLAFLFRNYSRNTLIVPNAPVQVSVIKRVHDAALRSPLTITEDGIDVTTDRLCQHGFFVAYEVGLAEEIAFIRKANHHLNIDGEDNSRYLERISITQALRHGFPDSFFLANTDEEIHTNGSPAYMFPFHTARIDGKEEFNIPSFHAMLMMREFTDKRHLPITGNAGILNPGTDGTVVYECLAHKRRNLARYLSREVPFGFVIPLPFADGSVDTTYGNGKHGAQGQIGF